MTAEIRSQENHLIVQAINITGDWLMANVERVRLKVGQVLHEPDDVMPYVYFPDGAIVSLLHVMESGDFAETAVIGNDGVVGVALIMGGESMPLRAQVQGDGFAWRLRSAALKQKLAETPRLQQVFLRYAQALLTQMAQVAACNRHHTLDQQLCRRLLMSLDRLPTNDIRLTQEAMAQMLGVRRESVTLAAHKLQKAGVIRYSRGHIQVLDRGMLEDQACECYLLVRKELRRLRVKALSGVEFVDPSVGLRTEGRDRAGQASRHPGLDGLANDVTNSASDRRRGRDRRELAGRRRNLIAIAFTDRRKSTPERRGKNKRG